MTKLLARALVGLSLAALGSAPLRAAGDVEMSEFYRRLDSLGMDTTFVRALTKKRGGPIEVFFKDADEDTEASYGWILNNLYIPDTYAEEGTKRLRFDLETHEIQTVMHELHHAAYDVRADGDAAVGTTERQLHDDVRAIWADLFNAGGLLPRYPDKKADEVAAYFFGDCYQRLFTIADLILFLNIELVNRTIQAPGDAARLGDRFVLPPEGNGMGDRVRKARFAEGNAGEDDAYFEGKPIPWRDRRHIKDSIFANGLGLKPPLTGMELLERMNDPKRNNAWIRARRRELRAARREAEDALEPAPAPPAGPEAGEGAGPFGIPR